MRFISPTARPALTPLGLRLLALSERKLADLDGVEYDEGHALWKGVLVRRAVRNAWQSIEDRPCSGAVMEMEPTSWHSQSATGLDVLAEEDEEVEEVDENRADASRVQVLEQETHEARWFEDLVSSFGDDDAYTEVAEAEHEWVESSVSMPADEFEYEYDTGNMEAYTLPSISPSLSPVVAAPSSPVTNVQAAFDSAVTAEVEIVEVDDEVEDADEEVVDALDAIVQIRHNHRWSITSSSSIESIPMTPIILGYSSPPSVAFSVSTQPSLSPLLPPSPLDLTHNHFVEYSEFVPSPDLSIYYTEFEEYIDDFSLPPPLLRSMSSSTSSTVGDDDDEVCRTPPLRSSELAHGDESATERELEEKFMWDMGGIFRAMSVSPR